MSGFINTLLAGFKVAGAHLVRYWYRNNPKENVQRSYVANNKYWVVGSNAYIAYSPTTDGLNWTSPYLGITNSITLNDIIYGGGRYVVVGSSGTVLTSADGITWASHTAGSGNNTRVAYGNSIYVLVNATNTGAIYTSTDGATWTLRNTGSAATGTALAYVNNQFVLGHSTGALWTSSDGINWTSVTSLGASITNILWNGSSYIVNPGGTCYYATSISGPWNNFGLTSGSQVGSIGFDGTQWLIYSSTYGTRKSTDGLGASWSPVVYTNASYIPTVPQLMYNGTSWLGINASMQISTSADGLVWTTSANTTSVLGTGLYSTPTVSLTTVAYYSGNYFLTSVTTTSIYKSSDLLTHTELPVPTASTNINTALVSTSVGLIGLGTTAGKISVTTDGVTWQSISVGSGAWYSAAGNTTTAVIVGAAGQIYYSTNGTSWTAATGSGSTDFHAITWSGSQFLAVNTGGTYYTSPTGATWTAGSAIGVVSSSTPNGLIYSSLASLYIGITGSTNVKTSSNGVTWVLSSTLSETPTHIVSNGTSIIACSFSNSNKYDYSTNGTTWTAKTLPIANSQFLLNYITTDGTNYIAVGNQGIILTSSDGLTWSNAKMRTSNLLPATLVKKLNSEYVSVSPYVASPTLYPTFLSNSSINGSWNTAPILGSGTGNSTAIYDVDYNPAGPLWVACGTDGTHPSTWSSPDGINWTVGTQSSTWTGYNASTAYGQRIVWTGTYWIVSILSTAGQAANQGGVFYSANGKTVWTGIVSGTSSGCFTDPSLGGVTFIQGTSGGSSSPPNFYQFSSNGGVSWSTASAGINFTPTYGNMIKTSTGVFIVAGGGLVFSSVDAGASWQNVTFTGSTGAVSIAYNGTAVVVLAGAGCYFSLDNGSTWTASSGVFPSGFGNMTSIVVDTNGIDFIAMDTRGATYKITI